jgi:O-methyltransferase
MAAVLFARCSHMTSTTLSAGRRRLKQLSQRAIVRLAPRLLRLWTLPMAFPPYPRSYQQDVAVTGDSVRVAAVGLYISRVERERIEGAMAELGVWRGEMSRLLHKMAPARDLYLFDSFAGFADDPADERFRDTSVTAVRRAIGGDNLRLHFREGWFPSTAEGLEDLRFAFVLLDGDRYQTTLDGLRFFYPRLNHGGYLMGHDYNSPESGWGVSRAFHEFLSDKPELLIELPDIYGSVVLRKI